jgi:hypothetical protein
MGGIILILTGVKTRIKQPNLYGEKLERSKLGRWNEYEER